MVVLNRKAAFAFYLVCFLTGEEPEKTEETKNQTDDDKPRRPPPDFRGIMMFINERFYGRVVTPELVSNFLFFIIGYVFNNRQMRFYTNEIQLQFSLGKLHLGGSLIKRTNFISEKTLHHLT